MRRIPVCVVIWLAVCWTCAAIGRPEPAAGDEAQAQEAIPFEVFAGFKRIDEGNPVFYCKPPEWAAAAHAIVVDDTVHYLWARRNKDNYWVLMHSTGKTRDSHNPVRPGIC